MYNIYIIKKKKTRAAEQYIEIVGKSKEKRLILILKIDICLTKLIYVHIFSENKQQ